MPTTINTGAELSPDVGDIKKENGEYSFLQNMRGWGKRIEKRNGIQFSQALDDGIMGIFDLYNDGDPLSNNRILVVSGGNFIFYEYAELTSVFDFLFYTGIKLLLQSPNLTWWDVTPDSTTGIIGPASTSAPSSSISTDLDILQSQLFGFNNASNIWRLFVGTNGAPTTQSYSTAGNVVLYSTDQAFVTGVGPVFEDSNLVRWRLTINNTGELVTTAI